MQGTDWELFKIQAIRAAGLDKLPRAKVEELYSYVWNLFGPYGKDEVLHALCDIGESLLEDV